MTDPRKTLDFAAPDTPLRDDVRRLGAVVGDMLAEQVSPAFLDEVEQVRTAAIARRQQDQPVQALAGLLQGRPPVQAERLVRAFSAYFQVVNVAERVHRIRRRRDYQRTASTPQPDGLRDVLVRLKAQGVTLAELRDWLPRLDIEPVFTAHPTEAMRRVLLEKEQLMVAALVADLDGHLTPGERALEVARFRTALTATWQTAEFSVERPGVEDEREHVGFYLGEVLYRVVPVLYETLEQAIEETWGEPLALPRLLRFGTWVGGDMDGNPNVDAATMAATLQAQRRQVLQLYAADLKRLSRLLSQTTGLVPVTPAVLARLEAYRVLLPQAAAAARPRHADMPYRLLLALMEARLQATAQQAPEAYPDADALAEDVGLLLDSLLQNRGLHAGGFAVRRLLWRVRTFGFHLARLDVRQESSVHAAALDDPAGAIAQRLDAVFAELARARRLHGADALGMYIISMARSRADVLAVLALARRGGLVDAQDAVPLDIAPLFETVDDLQHAPDTLRDLLADPDYRAHLAARGDVQTVMLGYSDSGKDGGIAASRWQLQRAQVELQAVAQAAGVRLTFFHGRGGSISRGGGKTTRALQASPRGSVDGRLRVTEQGEVIHRKYGIRALALRSLEQAGGAVLQASLRPRAPEPREAAWRETMAAVAEASTAAYRGLVAAPGFMAYFRGATPIDVIERMTLGSRPSRRLGEDAALSNLRAIPWVFAWAQCRAVVPGWYGLGSGLEAVAAAQRLQDMADHWPFFRTLLDDVAMVQAKSDLDIAERFSRLAGDALHEDFFPRIRREFQLTERWLLRLKRIDWLLQDDQRLALSIRLRNPYIDPMSVMQVDLLQRWRASGCEDPALLEALVACVNGVSQGLQNTG